MADKLMVNLFKTEGAVMQTLKYKLEYLAMKPALTHTKTPPLPLEGKGRRGLVKEGAYDKLNALAKGLNREGLNKERLTSLHPNVSMHNLHTILNIFPMAMTRRI